jgi:hypothetical protein
MTPEKKIISTVKESPCRLTGGLVLLGNLVVMLFGTISTRMKSLQIGSFDCALHLDFEIHIKELQRVFVLSIHFYLRIAHPIVSVCVANNLEIVVDYVVYSDIHVGHDLFRILDQFDLNYAYYMIHDVSPTFLVGAPAKKGPAPLHNYYLYMSYEQTFDLIWEDEGPNHANLIIMERPAPHSSGVLNCRMPCPGY